MTEFFQTAAVFLWLILAVFCAVIGKKYGPAGYLMSAMFLFMTVWYAPFSSTRMTGPSAPMKA